jgi:hypothetical protein
MVVDCLPKCRSCRIYTTSKIVTFIVCMTIDPTVNLASLENSGECCNMLISLLESAKPKKACQIQRSYDATVSSLKCDSELINKLSMLPCQEFFFHFVPKFISRTCEFFYPNLFLVLVSFSIQVYFSL